MTPASERTPLLAAGRAKAALSVALSAVLSSSLRRSSLSSRSLPRTASWPLLFRTGSWSACWAPRGRAPTCCTWGATHSWQPRRAAGWSWSPSTRQSTTRSTPRQGITNNYLVPSWRPLFNSSQAVCSLP